MRMGQAGRHGKKVLKVVEGKVLPLDRSLLMGEFPILYIPTDARGPSTQLLHTLDIDFHALPIWHWKMPFGFPILCGRGDTV
jgi:hypothetical protein